MHQYIIVSDYRGSILRDHAHRDRPQFYLITVRLCCHNTDYVHFNGHDRTIFVILAKCCIRLPDDGSSVIRNMSEQF